MKVYAYQSCHIGGPWVTHSLQAVNTQPVGPCVSHCCTPGEALKGKPHTTDTASTVGVYVLLVLLGGWRKRLEGWHALPALPRANGNPLITDTAGSGGLCTTSAAWVGQEDIAYCQHCPGGGKRSRGHPHRMWSMQHTTLDLPKLDSFDGKYFSRPQNKRCVPFCQHWQWTKT